MSVSRLSLYLESGAFTLPETGKIVVFGAVSGTDLSALPADRLQLVARMKPDVDAFRSAGFDVEVAAPSEAALAVVILPRAKAQARALIAQALDLAGCVIVDGQKTDGVDGIFRDMRKQAECSEAYSKAHGKTFVAKAEPGSFAAWSSIAEPAKNRDGFVTVPGVFSADGIDPASALLAASLPKTLGKRVADFGAGWGYLAGPILEKEGVRTLDLVEADRAALDCARRNVTNERVRFHWADATRWTPDAPLDAVVMNPPFHEGRKGVPELGQMFIRNAAAALAPGGRLYMVANRHLPYEQVLNAAFREVKELDGDGRFKIFVAARPSRKPR